VTSAADAKRSGGAAKLVSPLQPADARGLAGQHPGTVAASPSLTSVAILAAIVLIRTFLSFSLEVETTGRWPWQKRDIAAPQIKNGPAR
jgi:hypothetical protein